MSEQVHTIISPSPGKERGETQQLLVLSGVVDLALGLLKILIGWFANSHALIADGIHSFSDLATDVMVWLLNRIGAEEPDDDHPYGHARFETFGALVLGAVLIAVAGMLVYDSVLRLIEIESISIPTWPAIIATLVSIAAKEWLYHITRQLGEKLKSNLLLANAWHHRSDAFSSVIVLIGVSGAMLGVPWLEMIAAIGVAFMIAIIGWKLARDSVEELVDTALSEAYVADIHDTIELADGVCGVHSLRTRRMGSAVILDIHLQVDPTISVSEGHHIGDWVCQQLKMKFSEIRDITVHIDAEDDEQGTPEIMPPLRNEVRKALLGVWQNLLSEEEISKMTLHYLNNRINIELFLSDNTDENNSTYNRSRSHRKDRTEIENKDEFKLKLAESAKKFRWMGEISIWSK